MHKISVRLPEASWRHGVHVAPLSEAPCLAHDIWCLASDNGGQTRVLDPQSARTRCRVGNSPTNFAGLTMQLGEARGEVAGHDVRRAEGRRKGAVAV